MQRDGVVVNDWVGNWVDVEPGKTYRVHERASNHRKFAGKLVNVVDKRSNGFGMVWAYVVETGTASFNGGEPHVPAEGWVRTCFFEPDPVER